ncbi:MAG: hypothetical protein R3F11_27560 [Verrucomicrobiales bacterium]
MHAVQRLARRRGRRESAASSAARASPRRRRGGRITATASPAARISARSASFDLRFVAPPASLKTPSSKRTNSAWVIVPE